MASHMDAQGIIISKFCYIRYLIVSIKTAIYHVAVAREKKLKKRERGTSGRMPMTLT